MGKLRPKRRQSKIRINRQRKAKLSVLRRKYSSAKSELEKEKILEKALKISPWLSKEEFLASATKVIKKD